MARILATPFRRGRRGEARPPASPGVVLSPVPPKRTRPAPPAESATPDPLAPRAQRSALPDAPDLLGDLDAARARLRKRIAPRSDA